MKEWVPYIAILVAIMMPLFLRWLDRHRHQGTWEKSIASLEKDVEELDKKVHMRLLKEDHTKLSEKHHQLAERVAKVEAKQNGKH